jgi:hypothetical protein
MKHSVMLPHISVLTLAKTEVDNIRKLPRYGLPFLTVPTISFSDNGTKPSLRNL